MVVRIGLYAATTIGPVAAAASQFLLSLVLLRQLTPAAFGTFSFLLVAVQLSWGIWSALFCAPLPVVLARHNGTNRTALVEAIFSANLLGAAGLLVLFGCMGLVVGLTGKSAALFAAFGTASVLRWFGRSYAFATGTPMRSVASDLTYSGLLTAGALVTAVHGDPTLAYTWGSLLVATCMGFVPFGRLYLTSQFAKPRAGWLRHYAPIWREHSRWALLGVVSTEATANAHVYIVTALRGPSEFAPLAASALLIRPITVAMNALSEYERARMARQVGKEDFDGARGSVRFFRIMLLVAWAITALGAVLLFAMKLSLLFPARYDGSLITWGAALWIAVALVRILRMPESCLLQAGGAFRPLALASVWSSFVSVAAVLILLAYSGPLASIVGILLGEGAFALWIWRQSARWLAERVNVHT
jgi:hypothetical protein